MGAWFDDHQALQARCCAFCSQDKLYESMQVLEDELALA